MNNELKYKVEACKKYLFYVYDLSKHLGINICGELLKYPNRLIFLDRCKKRKNFKKQNMEFLILLTERIDF